MIACCVLEPPAVIVRNSEWLLWIHFLSMNHTISIGFKSGEYDDHDIIGQPCLSNQSITRSQVWTHALSYIKIQFLNPSSISGRHFWYASSTISPLMPFFPVRSSSGNSTISLPFSRPAKHAQNITELLVSLDIGSMQSWCHFSCGVRNTQVACLPSDFETDISSLQTTSHKSSAVKC